MVLMRIRLSNIIFLIAILVYTEKKYCFISEKKEILIRFLMYFTNCFKYFVDVIELMIQWSKTEQNTNHDHCELTNSFEEH